MFEEGGAHGCHGQTGDQDYHDDRGLSESHDGGGGGGDGQVEGGRVGWLVVDQRQYNGDSMRVSVHGGSEITTGSSE